MKDLPDIALLADAGVLDGSNVARAIAETFGHRATHPVPPRLPDPPEAWSPVYARLAEEEDLPWPDLTSLGGAVRAFLDPLLAGQNTGTSRRTQSKRVGRTAAVAA